ncbi:MAG: bifunctional UDP-sugar hydrolase/5'-nucleotidase [Bacteroidota bacterium]
MHAPSRSLRRTAFLLVVLGAIALRVFPQSRTLTILHTNDMHAGFIPHEAIWVKKTPKPMIGGFRELFFVSDSIKQSVGPVLMLDAGDVMTGNPITEKMYDGASGGALFAMMNMVGYDAWCFGNHDLDISQENLRALVRIARFPSLSANLVDSSGGYPLGNQPYVVIERGGIRVGIVGIMSQELYSLVHQGNLVGLRVLSPAATVQRFIDALDPATDLLIALTHEGVEEDSLLATQVHGLDIIVGGHSHTRLRSPILVNGVIIVQTGSNVENLGELNITVEGDRVTSFDGHLIPLWAGGSRPPSPVTHLTDSMQAVIEKEYSEVLATLNKDWIRRDAQSPIGTFIAEAQRVAVSADVGFMNTHGIRRDVPAGPITKRILFEVLPFRNLLTTFQLTGRELRSVMTFAIEQKFAVQVAGLTCRWRRRPDGTADIRAIEVGGRPLEDDKTYVCAASDYLVGEAKRLLGIEVRQPITLQRTLFAAVEEAVRAAKSITPRVLYTIQEDK